MTKLKTKLPHDAILELRRSGHSVQQVAEMAGLSKNRIVQIVRESTITGRVSRTKPMEFKTNFRTPADYMLWMRVNGRGEYWSTRDALRENRRLWHIEFTHNDGTQALCSAYRKMDLPGMVYREYQQLKTKVAK